MSPATFTPAIPTTKTRHPSHLRRSATALVVGATLAAAAGGLVAGSPALAAGNGPCDLYAAGGTPCVAAHSTTRALYASYDGPLYQVRRASDNATWNVGPLSAGGTANSATQDSFCSGTTCQITVIYDQSGKGNHLTQAPPGGVSGPAPGGYDNLADATAAPIQLGGRRVYGVLVTPGTGYRNDKTTGVPTGDQAEGMYAVLDGTRYNGGCCFEYGNTTTNNRNNGAGTAEAISFGNGTSTGYGAGNGPWITAELGGGTFSGAASNYNAGDPTIGHRFLTAVLKGEPDHWALRGGNAASGGLSTFYDGRRPDGAGYDPMRKEGGILLGIGSDNSNKGTGTFYEGVVTSGYPAAATENAVQAGIVAAGYGGTTTTTTPTPTPSGSLAPGSRISLKVTTACCTGNYIRHDGAGTVTTAGVTPSSSTTDKAAATWIVRAGLADKTCVSFEAADAPGKYLRHKTFQIFAHANDGTAPFTKDATYCPKPGNSGTGYSFRSVNYPDKYLRHYENVLYLAANGGLYPWDVTTSWTADTSWAVVPAWS